MNENEKQTDEDQGIPYLWPVLVFLAPFFGVFLAFAVASLFFDVPMAVLTR